MKKLQRLFRNPFILLLLLIIVIMAVDRLLSRFSFNSAGNYILHIDELQGLVAFNSILEEIWFAETIAIIIFPIVLLLFRKKWQLKTHLFPWCIAAIVMLAGAVGTGISIHDRIVNGFYRESPNDLSLSIHHGASYFPAYVEDDPFLFSILPAFLRAQAPIMLGYVAGAFGIGLYKAAKHPKP
jgi:lysylphosphatidylglycerol synthetase-like protein (DUF2156 family)